MNPRASGCWSILLLLASCGGSAPPTTPGPTTPQPLEIVAPSFTLAPGEEKTYCFYTRLKNARKIGVKRWESTMSPGSHHMIVFITRDPIEPEGTLKECGLFGRTGVADPTRGIPIWVYASQEPTSEARMPDGVGMTLEANQPVIVQMHYLNASSANLRAELQVKIHQHTSDDYIPASVFVTYDTQINVPPGADGEVTGKCIAPSGGKFFAMTTHSHQFTGRAQVLDGDKVLVDTDDWEHPAVNEWKADSYYTFESGYVSYRCTYSNPTGRRLRTGDSAETDEMCMAIGYFFPATGMRFCIDGFVLPF